MSISHLLPIAVFDLDGTLADTAPDIIAVLNHLLHGEGLGPVPVDSARILVGSGARALISRGYELQGRALEPEKLDALFQKFLSLYENRIAQESCLFPGVETVLGHLKKAGVRLAVCTNKGERLSRLLLKTLGVLDYFQAVCGRDTFAICKPDPQHLISTIEAAGGDPNRAVMIGDSKTDLLTARGAGVPIILVPFGYTDTSVDELQPDAVVERFGDMVPVIETLIGGFPLQRGSSEQGLLDGTGDGRHL